MFWFILLDSGLKRQAAYIFFLSRQDSEGVGQKNQRANSAGVLQQSLHKRRGLCNDCGLVLRNFSLAHPDASNVTESYYTELKHTL